MGHEQRFTSEFDMILPAACTTESNKLSCNLQGDKIILKVNKLNSVKNLPYEYYSLPYCRPEKVISSAENLGEILRGDRIENSPYQVSCTFHQITC